MANNIFGPCWKEQAKVQVKFFAFIPKRTAIIKVEVRKSFAKVLY